MIMEKKMIYIKELKDLGILGMLRQRREIDKDDNSQDEEIIKMTADKVLLEWSAWHLGDPSWWSTMKGMFDKLDDSRKLTHDRYLCPLCKSEILDGEMFKPHRTGNAHIECLKALWDNTEGTRV